MDGRIKVGSSSVFSQLNLLESKLSDIKRKLLEQEKQITSKIQTSKKLIGTSSNQTYQQDLETQTKNLKNLETFFLDNILELYLPSFQEADQALDKLIQNQAQVSLTYSKGEPEEKIKKIESSPETSDFVTKLAQIQVFKDIPEIKSLQWFASKMIILEIDLGEKLQKLQCIAIVTYPENCVYLVTTKDFKLYARLTGITSCMQFDSLAKISNNRLAVSSSDGCIYIYDLKKMGNDVEPDQVIRRGGFIYTILWIKNMLVVGDNWDDNAVKLLVEDPKTQRFTEFLEYQENKDLGKEKGQNYLLAGTDAKKPKNRIGSHGADIRAMVKLAEDEKNNFFATGSWDKTVKVWNLDTLQEEATIEEKSCVCKIEKLNENEIIVGQKLPVLQIWNWKDRVLLKSYDLLKLEWISSIQLIDSDSNLQFILTSHSDTVNSSVPLLWNFNNANPVKIGEFPEKDRIISTIQPQKDSPDLIIALTTTGLKFLQFFEKKKDQQQK